MLRELYTVSCDGIYNVKLGMEGNEIGVEKNNKDFLCINPKNTISAPLVHKTLGIQ